MNVKNSDLLITLKVEDLIEVINNLKSDQIAQKKNGNKMNQLLPLKDCCEIFDVSLTTIHKWKKLGLLPRVIKMGGRRYFDKVELQETIERNKK